MIVKFVMVVISIMFLVFRLSMLECLLINSLMVVSSKGVLVLMEVVMRGVSCFMFCFDFLDFFFLC